MVEAIRKVHVCCLKYLFPYSELYSELYENSSLNKYLLLDDMPKTVDVCGTEVSLDLKSDYSEEILSDSVDSKSLLENLVRNNSECTGFLMWFSVLCMTRIFKPTERSKYVYSLLLFNESQQPLIEYTKTVNSTASLVAAISNIQKLHQQLHLRYPAW